MDSEKQVYRHEANKYKALVSFVSKDYNLSIVSLTVRETLEYAVRFKLPMRSNNPLWSTREERLELLLRNYGLKHKENSLCSTLSTGEKRRLSIAVQNVLFHRILILEDPTDGMEFGESFLMMRRLKNIAGKFIDKVV